MEHQGKEVNITDMMSHLISKVLSDSLHILFKKKKQQKTKKKTEVIKIN